MEISKHQFMEIS